MEIYWKWCVMGIRCALGLFNRVGSERGNRELQLIMYNNVIFCFLTIINPLNSIFIIPT